MILEISVSSNSCLTIIHLIFKSLLIFLMYLCQFLPLFYIIRCKKMRFMEKPNVINYKHMGANALSLI